MKSEVSIGKKKIGQGHNTYIVAELSANHGGSYEKAEELVHTASQAGADAVKLQTYTADTMTLDCKGPRFIHGSDSIWAGLSLYELYQMAQTPWEWHPRLKKLANELGMELFSSPFDKSAVDFLDDLDVPAYKIASFEIIDLPLVEYVATRKKPIIFSTGMASITEIDEAIACARSAGAEEIILLKCVSAYPTTFKDMNLVTIPHMANSFQCPIGLSDHSRGITAPVVAATLGASVIEKHLTLSHTYKTPDQKFSLDPKEFSDMVHTIRNAEKCLGEVKYGAGLAEGESESFRRSLYITDDLREGDILTIDNCRSIRPGGGLMPKYHKIVLGKKIVKDVKRGTPLSWDLLLQ